MLYAILSLTFCHFTAILAVFLPISRIGTRFEKLVYEMSNQLKLIEYEII